MVTLLGDTDLHLFNEGTHQRLHDRLGAHVLQREDGTVGTYFAVWAPNAGEVRVRGDFSGWGDGAKLEPRGGSGIWEGFVAGVEHGALYKFAIRPRESGVFLEKADPFARFAEIPPRTASAVWNEPYAWQDHEWMSTRAARNALDAPLSVYELHLGSWKRKADGYSLGYREIADPLIEHVTRLGFTHVEFLPLTEHPFYGSWGYQCTGYFAPTSRYGNPNDLKYLIDRLHRAGIGVILDWVPSHFPDDAHALAQFDGTHLFEHADPRQGFHPDWNTLVFNYGRHEVRSFLLSSACFWLEHYHIDGLRLDAVASMLYLDYSRAEGQWIANPYGGRENLDAISFLRELNTRIGADFPDVQTLAEESTAWPMVSRPVHVGGLGFHLKWDMGWMHDTLKYMARDPVHRKYHHNEITFRSIYAFSENFIMPLSHDEVVHGKGSLLRKMPGDDWQKFANLRLLYGYMYTQPGKKLLFMGSEFGQWGEWSHDGQLEWPLLDQPRHGGLMRFLGDLNHLYRSEPALYERDCDPAGHAWIDGSDQQNCLLAYMRQGRGSDVIIAVCNFTPVPRHNYRIGAPHAGFWREVLNSDAAVYGGSGQGNLGGLQSSPVPMHGHWHSLNVTVPPLGIVILKSLERG